MDLLTELAILVLAAINTGNNLLFLILACLLAGILISGILQRIVLTGEPPNPMDPPSGCPFRLRCWKAQDVCSQQRPELVETRPAHWTACHFPDET